MLLDPLAVLDRLQADADAPSLTPTTPVRVFSDAANGVHAAADCLNVTASFTLPLRSVFDRAPAYGCPQCGGWRDTQEGQLIIAAAKYHALLDAPAPVSWRQALELHRHAQTPCAHPPLAALHNRASAQAGLLADQARSHLDPYPLYASVAVFAVEFSVRPSDASRLAGWFRAQSLEETSQACTTWDSPLADAIASSPSSWCLVKTRDGAYGAGAVLWGTALRRASSHGTQLALAYLPHVVQAGLEACNAELVRCDRDQGIAAVGLYDPSFEPLSTIPGVLEAAAVLT